MSGAATGITFQPDAQYLQLLAPALERADYLEVAPETLWVADGAGLRPNGFHRQVQRHAERGKTIVAHGVGLSLGSIDSADRVRREQWLERIAEDHRMLRYAWYTDHLGASVVAGENVALPMALPMCDAWARALRDNLAALQRIVADVGVETTVHYCSPGDWLHEPAFLASVLSAPRTHLVLDLHNVYTMAINLGIEAEDYLQRVDLDSVIEIHVSGGRRSDPAWLPNGRTLRLDSHDAAVPEPVWALCETWAPRCRRLRGITLERMEGTVAAGDVDPLLRELDRVRAIADRCGREIPAALETTPPHLVDGEWRTDVDTDSLGEAAHWLAGALRDPDSAPPPPPPMAGVHSDGLRIATLLVAKLRFERLQHGSMLARRWWDRDPKGFSRAFRDYHRDTPMLAHEPRAEAHHFAAWASRTGAGAP